MPYASSPCMPYVDLNRADEAFKGYCELLCSAIQQGIDVRESAFIACKAGFLQHGIAVLIAVC